MAKKAAQSSAPTSAPQDQHQQLYLATGQLRPSKSNPRRLVKDAAFAELVASVRVHGVLQPLLVSPLESSTTGAYQLVAGHRRLAAAIEAGVERVPCIARFLSEREILEIQVVENLQRTDLHPLEEAAGYRQLMRLGFDAAKIAERIGRSVKYVYDRAKLLELTPAAQRFFFAGRITAGHAILLARLKPADQARAIAPKEEEMRRGQGGLWREEDADLFGDHTATAKERKTDPTAGLVVRSVRELSHWIDEHVKLDPLAPVVADLFPETHQAIAKATAVAKASTKAAKIVPITREYFCPEDARDGERVYTERSWKRADGELEDRGYGKPKKSKTCDRSVLGVIVIGEGRGQAFPVCVSKSCAIHWPKEKKRKASGSDGRAAKAYQEQERKRKLEQERRDAARERWRKAVPAILEAVAAAVKKAKVSSSGPLAELLVGAVMRYGGRAPGAVPRGKTAEDLVRHLAFAILAEQARNDWNGYELFPKRARAVGVDVSKILAAKAPVQTSAKKKGGAK